MEPFIYPRVANYYETDQMGVIHHSNYIRWMEEARVAWMNALGFGYKQMEACGVVSPVVGISLSYHRPVHFDDSVEIGVRVEKYTGVVLELAYEVRLRGSEKICTRGTSRHCFLQDGRTVSLRKALPEMDRILQNQLPQDREASAPENDHDVSNQRKE